MKDFSELVAEVKEDQAEAARGAFKYRIEVLLDAIKDGELDLAANQTSLFNLRNDMAKLKTEYEDAEKEAS